MTGAIFDFIIIIIIIIISAQCERSTWYKTLEEASTHKRIEVRPTALPRLQALDSAAAVGLGRATPHASPR